jgi:cyclopropane fatty-acyl-phospholipid synthase-like methyltransferase
VTPLYRAADKCRACGNTELVPILDLGMQCMTGIFPKADQPDPPAGPLELVKCHGSSDVCQLVQLKHIYDGTAMYGQSYGYRSSLNRSMVEHLRRKAGELMKTVELRRGDIVLDIGSNDGTSLSAYPKDGPLLIGIDPTAAKFKEFYPPHIRAVAEFFSAASFRKAAGSDGAKAKIVTSISMFYDLDEPMQFMRDIHEILADDGIWHLEQSYMPGMLERDSYDTVCHEHVEYYSLSQIAWMAARVGFRIRDVAFNDVNGASFALTLEKTGKATRHEPRVEALLADEAKQGLATLDPYRKFEERVARHRDDLRAKLAELRSAGKKVFGLGSSTKGNVVLQWCRLGPADIECIAEVNADKFGCVTPGTRIPIVSESEAHDRRPDVFLVLPWHFRSHFLQSEKAFMSAGGHLLFPLPRIESIP